MTLADVRRRRSVAVAVVLAALTAAACGDDDATTTTSAAVTTVTRDDTATTSTTATGTLIEIKVSGGEVAGGGTRDVALGDEVTLRVSADVADEVHVHGYDLTADVEPGTAVEIRFTADIPGVFEVELERARLPLAELRVS
jgi:heme/copper-type cytochrome/quinol oxidase subunit 2